MACANFAPFVRHNVSRMFWGLSMGWAKFIPVSAICATISAVTWALVKCLQAKSLILALRHVIPGRERHAGFLNEINGRFLRHNTTPLSGGWVDRENARATKDRSARKGPLDATPFLTTEQRSEVGLQFGVVAQISGAALGALLIGAVPAQSVVAQPARRLTTQQLLELAARCAPHTAPGTILSIVRVESGGNPFATHVNHNLTVDYGLGQINDSNLVRLGLDGATVFDPCLNLAAAERVLMEGYRPVGESENARQEALRRALAAYNVGPRGSLAVGSAYASRVAAAANYVIPEIRAVAGVPSAPPQTGAARKDGGVASPAIPPSACPSADDWQVRPMPEGCSDAFSPNSNP